MRFFAMWRLICPMAMICSFILRVLLSDRSQIVSTQEVVIFVIFGLLCLESSYFALGLVLASHEIFIKLV